MKATKVTQSILGFELELGGQDVAGGVILEADEGEARTAALEPVVTTGIGLQHHASAGAAWAAGAIFAGTTLLRGGQLGPPQNTAQGFAAEAESFILHQLVVKMRVVEAGILGAGQFQHPLAQGRIERPGFGPAPIAMLYPGGGIGLITPLQALYLPFATLQ